MFRGMNILGGVLAVGGTLCLGFFGGGRSGENIGVNINTGTHQTCYHNLLVCQRLFVKHFVF